MLKTKSQNILVVVCAAQFFLPFMMAGVNSALPPIGQDTLASAKELSLLTTFYALGLATFQLTTGRMGDIWGRRRIFLIGLGIFILSSVCIGMSNNIMLMQGFRFIQGTGAAMFAASGLAILATVAPDGKRGQYIGFSAAVVYAGIACGPPVAGFIAGSIGWRWIFYSNAIAATIAWVLMCFTVKDEWYEGKGEPFDWRGGFLYGAGMATLAIGSTILQDLPIKGILLLCTGLGLLIIYVMLESRTQYPLLDINLLLKNRVFALSSLAAFVNYSASFGMILFFSLYLQVVRGMSVNDAGLFLALQFVVQALATPLASRLADSHGPGRISAIGIGLCGLGLCACAFLGRDSHLIFFVIAQIILGLSMSFFAAPNTTVMLESVDRAHVGQAASFVGTMRTCGALVNTTIISMTLGYFLGNAPVSVDNIDEFLMSMRVDLILFGIFNIAAIGCALGRERIKEA